MRHSILSNEVVQEKYIRICEGSIRVKIERAQKTLIEHFSIRKYHSFDAAMAAAIAWRDQKHMEVFGCPVPKNIMHIAPRRNRKTQVDPKTGDSLPVLPAGLSYGFHGGKLRYIVVSYQDKNRPVRKRFPIDKLGFEEAKALALEFRSGLFCS